MSMLVAPLTASYLEQAIVPAPLTIARHQSVMAAIAQMNHAAANTAVTINPIKQLHHTARCSCVLVVEAGKVLGIFTERDVVRLIGEGRSLDQICIETVMHHPAITLPQTQFTDPSIALTILQHHSIQHLAVTNDQEEVIGLLTRETLHGLLDTLRPAPIDSDTCNPHPVPHHSPVDYAQSLLDILEAARDIIASADHSGTITYLNRAGRTLLGIDPEEDLSQTRIPDYHAPQVAERILQEALPHATRNGFWEGETQFRRRDGKEISVWQIIVAHRRQDGSISHFSTIARDHTERKQTEARLQRSLKALEDFKYALDQAAIVAITDIQGRITYANDKFCEISKYTRDELLGQNHRILQSGYHPPEFFRHLWQTIAHGQVWHGEIQNRAKDGTLYWVDTTIVPFLDEYGSPYQYIAIRRDTTARKLAEERLRHSEEQLRLALRAANQGFYDLNLKTGEAIVSPEYVTMLGYDPATFQETNAKWIARLHPDDQESLANTYRDYVAGAIPEYKVEFRQRTQTGDWKWILSLGKIVTWDQDGQPLRMLGTHTDISDRKQAELERQQALQALHELNLDLEVRVAQRTAELQEREAQLRDFFDNATDLIQGVAPDGKILFVNRAWQEALGYTLEELKQLSIFDIIHPDSWQHCRNMMQMVLSGQICTGVEAQFVTKDGRIIVVEGNANCRFENGQAIATRGIFRDITTRKQAEQALRKINTVLQNAMEGISQLDRQGRYQMVNRAYAQICGYEPDELIGQPWQITVYPEDLPQLQQGYKTMLSTGKAELEARGRKKDGSLFYKQITMIGARDQQGTLTGHYCFMKDISERKQAEISIRQSQEELERFFTVALDLLCIADADGYFRRLNPSWSNILGYSIEELEGIQFLDLVHPDDIPSTLQAMSQLDNQQSVLNFVNRYRCKDGSYRYIEWRSHPHNHLIYAAARDITESKQAEAKFQENALQLEAANRELEAFAYSVSHDLRAPLRAVDGFSQALLEDYGDRFDDVGQDYFRRIRGGVQRMGLLIDDLLRLSRVSRSEMQRCEVNLSEMVLRILTELHESDPDRLVDLIITPMAIVQADPNLMRVALENLLQNAWKFTSHHPTCRIEFGVSQINGQRTYFVRDDGAGFDMAFADKLFGVFQRLHDTHEFPGTGIGLATVQRVIYRHGGRVWAAGAIEQGATVYFTLLETNGKGE